MFGESALPTNAEAGLEPEVVDRESMVKVALEETTPSVVTVTVAMPGLAIRLEGTAASSCVESS
jgi:hypothetical protein